MRQLLRLIRRRDVHTYVYINEHSPPPLRLPIRRSLFACANLSRARFIFPHRYILALSPSVQASIYTLCKKQPRLAARLARLAQAEDTRHDMITPPRRRRRRRGCRRDPPSAHDPTVGGAHTQRANFPSVRRARARRQLSAGAARTQRGKLTGTQMSEFTRSLSASASIPLLVFPSTPSPLSLFVTIGH